MDINHYAYSVDWEADDEIYIARVVEFPSLAAHGATHEEALAELRFVVGEVVAELADNGDPVPVALSERAYSGKFNVRLPKDLHRELVLAAYRQGVSLNQYVLRKLSR